MTRFRFRLASLLRSDDDQLSSGARNQILLHRLLLLLGGALASAFGVLQANLTPGAVTAAWPSGLLAGLFVGLFAGSYVSRGIRRRLVTTTRVLTFALMAWLIAVTVRGGFAEGDATILLFAYVVLTPAIGFAGRSLWPALLFAGASVLGTAGGALFTSAPDGRPSFLLGCILAASVVEALAARLLAERRTADQVTTSRTHERSLPSVTDNAPMALFRTAPGDGLIYANQAFAETFGYETVVDVLLADLDSLFANPDERERLWKKAKRESALRSIELKLKRNNGSVFTGLLNLRVAYGENDEVICFDGTVTDISERKRREQVRRQSMAELARTADEKDYCDEGHVERVGTLARLIAGSMGLPTRWQKRIEEAAPFHDVGKVGIAEQILRKPGPLSEHERQTMEQHASIGPALLSGSKSEHLRIARRIARSHHERWDGEGYPEGLEGNDIPLAARIVAVADAFDAMTHDRPYREALSPDEAFGVIRDEAGAQFDPNVSKAALQCREAMTELVADEEPSTEPAAETTETEEMHQVAPSLPVAQPA